MQQVKLNIMTFTDDDEILESVNESPTHPKFNQHKEDQSQTSNKE